MFVLKGNATKLVAGKGIKKVLSMKNLVTKTNVGNMFVDVVNGDALHIYVDKPNPVDLIELCQTSCAPLSAGTSEYDLNGFEVLFADGEVSVKYAEQKIVDITFEGNDTVFAPCGDYKVFGLGDKMAYLDRRGYAYRNWNTDDCAHQDEQFKALYKSVNYLLINVDGKFFSVFFPSTYPYDFDLGKTNDAEIRVTNQYVNQDFYLFLGDVRTVTSNYSKLVGHPYFVRYKMLGNNQSRFTYKSQQEVCELVENFDKHDLPLDYVHLDIDFMDGFRNGTVNKSAYPDFGGMCKKLADNGIGVIVINDAGDKVDENFETYRYISQNKLAAQKDGKDYVNVVWPGDSVFPNYFKQQLKEYKNAVMTRFVEQNHIDGIWNDMNEPASFNGELPLDVDFSYGDRKLTNLEGHNVYGEHMVRSLLGIFESKNRRPYLFSRAAFATTAKYCFFWNGDNASLWHHLKLSIPQIIGMGLSGLMFNGVDVGGFNADVTKQLLIRWIEAGVLYPFLRNHASIDTTRQEPYAFDEETTTIYRNMLRLRYSLAPYLYNQAYFMSTHGELFNAPLFYYYPSDAEAYKCNDEYMVGESILVAPITDKDVDKRMVYLPDGAWLDYLCGTEYVGGKTYLLDMPLDSVGLFVRKQSIVPMTEPKNRMDKATNDTLVLYIYGDNCQTEIYDDDGDSLNYRHGVYNKYAVSYRDGVVSFATTYKNYDATYKKIVIKDATSGKQVELPFGYEFTTEF